MRLRYIYCIQLAFVNQLVEVESISTEEVEGCTFAEEAYIRTLVLIILPRVGVKVVGLVREFIRLGVVEERTEAKLNHKELTC